jgi:hypothetical protein
MPYQLWAECPCCHRTAKGSLQQIRQIFGFRHIKSKTIPQSFCRRCRRAKCTKSLEKH